MTELDPEVQAVADALEAEFTKDELVALADEFAVELKSGMRKDAIARAYAEDGVSVEVIMALREPEADAPVEDELVEDAALVAVVDPEEDVVEDEDDLVLVRMTRLNGTYQIRGYTFKREHPFVLVKEDDADYLIEVDGGFRMASPKEARAFYS